MCFVANLVIVKNRLKKVQQEENQGMALLEPGDAPKEELGGGGWVRGEGSKVHKSVLLICTHSVFLYTY